MLLSKDTQKSKNGVLALIRWKQVAENTIEEKPSWNLATDHSL
jgi:hypothetical protein